MAPIGHARACARLLALIVTTTSFYLYAVAVTGLAVDVDDRRRQRRRSAVFGAWSRVVACILGVRVHARGHCPPTAALVIGNHLSYLDILVLAMQTPLVFVAKSEVARWPIVGYLCRFVGTLFVDRTSRSRLPATTSEIADLLAAGIRVAVFPEGTTTRGDRVLPFRPALLQPAVDQRAPVACVALTYETPRGWPSAQTSVCWWGDMAFAGHFYRLMTLPFIEARLAWCEDPLVEASRRTLAQRAHARITQRVQRLHEAPLPHETPAHRPARSRRRADDERREARGIDLLDRQRLEPRGVEHVGET